MRYPRIEHRTNGLFLLISSGQEVQLARRAVGVLYERATGKLLEIGEAEAILPRMGAVMQRGGYAPEQIEMLQIPIGRMDIRLLKQLNYCLWIEGYCAYLGDRMRPGNGFIPQTYNTFERIA